MADWVGLKLKLRMLQSTRTTEMSHPLGTIPYFSSNQMCGRPLQYETRSMSRAPVRHGQRQWRIQRWHSKHSRLRFRLDSRPCSEKENANQWLDTRCHHPLAICSGDTGEYDTMHLFNTSHIFSILQTYLNRDTLCQRADSLYLAYPQS
jgi:hypothetical protein